MDEIERIKSNWTKFGKALRHDDVGTLLAALDTEKARVKELEARNAELASEVNLCRRAVNRNVTDYTQLRERVREVLGEMRISATRLNAVHGRSVLDWADKLEAAISAGEGGA